LIKAAFNERNYSRAVSFVQKNAIGGGFFVLILLLIGYLTYSTIIWMLDDQRLPLSRIILQGDLHHVSALDVQRAFSQLEHVGTFMTQDVRELQVAAESISWVSHAAIRKQWPDTVKVYLTEHKALAIWNGNVLLDTYGQLFNADIGQADDGLVKLYGPDGTNNEVLDTWKIVTPMFKELELSITSLVLNDRRAWQLILDNGVRLELGKESLMERVKRFVNLYKKLGEDAQNVSYIDLRYDTGASIGWFPKQELTQENLNDKVL